MQNKTSSKDSNDSAVYSEVYQKFHINMMQFFKLKSIVSIKLSVNEYMKDHIFGLWRKM